MTQKMCDKVVDTYPSTIKFVPECFRTQEMSDKLVNILSFVFDSTTKGFVSEYPLLIVCCLP